MIVVSTKRKCSIGRSTSCVISSSNVSIPAHSKPKRRNNGFPDRKETSDGPVSFFPAPESGEHIHSGICRCACRSGIATTDLLVYLTGKRFVEQSAYILTSQWTDPVPVECSRPPWTCRSSAEVMTPPTARSPWGCSDAMGLNAWNF
jgi:hypothetical protein